MTHPAVDAAFHHWSQGIHHWSRWALRQVQVPATVLQRTEGLPVATDRRVSVNGSCRLLQARDGWIALNLPRAGDHDLVPALLGRPLHRDTWSDVIDEAASWDADALLAQAHLLGLAASRVGETAPPKRGLDRWEDGNGKARRWVRAPRVLDLSALWAGPLSSTVLAWAGCEVVRVDGRSPPDRFGQEPRPGIGRLDDGKHILHLALDQSSGRRQLHALLAQSDVVITGMRRRAIDALGIREAIASAGTDRIVWLAITAHGLAGTGGDRIGLGDDCAAAGGLVDWTPAGRPQFIGDAIADPLTGLRAAAMVLRALARGEGGMLDIALAATSADTVQRSARQVKAVEC